jgi:hypothetical protein
VVTFSGPANEGHSDAMTFHLLPTQWDGISWSANHGLTASVTANTTYEGPEGDSINSEAFYASMNPAHFVTVKGHMEGDNFIADDIKLGQ